MQNQYDEDTFFNMYKEIRHSQLSYNEIVEFPEIKRHMPDLNSKHVLDIGCGFGHLLKYMKTLEPASITGIDQSEKMINHCRADADLKDATFIQGDILSLSSSDQYDFIISSLVFHYIEDFDLLSKKLYELLSGDGQLLFTIEHPIQTATVEKDLVMEDEQGIYARVDHYFKESIRDSHWSNGIIIKKYHHKMDTILNSLIQNGFQIEAVKDLGDAAEVFDYYSDERIHKLQTFPPFLLIKCRKEK